MRRFDIEERRVRLARRHHLPRRSPSAEEAAAGAVGLHSSDPATVFLSALARVDGFEVDDLERALYDDRTLVRMLGMRRTLFVVGRETAAVMNAACTQALYAPERRRTESFLEGHVDDPAGWLERVSAEVLEVLRRRGEATAVELTTEIPELGLKVPYGEGTKWAGVVGMSTRVLFLLATAGLILRGRPRGSWRSGQYRWAPVEIWLGEHLADLPTEEARVALLRRWLAGHGPATFTDISWWTGWGKGVTRKALDQSGAVEVDIEEAGSGWALADDLEGSEPVEEWVALLPGLDPAPMGWKQREWFMGEHTPRLFDRNGNAGPMIWFNGRVVGGWSQRPDGEVAFRLLDDVGWEAAAAVEREADRLQQWLGGHRVIPRFRTPLEKELSG
jgi:hypothetical protein